MASMGEGNSAQQQRAQVVTVVLLLLLAAMTLVFSRVIFSTYFNDGVVVIEDKRFAVTVADDPQERAQGLSGRSKLGKDQGMLFVFNSPDYYCFWMEDMNFPIDIIWVNEARSVIDVQSDVAPDSYPQSFCPSEPAQYVIELNQEVAEENNISRGSKVQF